jgi:hypothetical protein
MSQLSWEALTKMIRAIWAALGPLVGVFIGAYLARRWRRDEWIADNKRSEYRKLLTTLAKTFTSIVELRASGVALGPKEQRRLFNLEVQASAVILDRIFIAEEVKEMNLLKRWNQALRTYDNSLDADTFGKEFGVIASDLRKSATKVIRDHDSETQGVNHPARSNFIRFAQGWSTRAKNTALARAIFWLFGKLWEWGPLSFIVGTVCIGVGIVLAQERMYWLARSLVSLGAVIVVLKLVHDSFAENKPKKEVLAAFLIVGIILTLVTLGAWWIIEKMEWKNEILIRVTFKSSPVFTPKRQKQIIWDLNKYYRYMTDLGFDLPPDIPPLGLTPPHGLLLGGGSAGSPSYFSSIYISEDTVDDPKVLRFVYSQSFFNSSLVNPYGASRPEAEDDEIAAWVYSCYYPVSFGGQQVCATEAPGHKWNNAIWEIRQKFGAEYTDRLLCYSFKMWKAIPAKYADNFDRFFRYKLVSGETVADNGGGQRYQELNAIFDRHGIDTTQPQ